jgi:phosphoribosyl 1,2-cyclic phosphate phosphodiesterase
VLEKDFGQVSFGGQTRQYMSFTQGGMKVMGYRLGKFAYVLDIRQFTPEVITALEGVETLVLSALRHRPSPAHFTVEEGVEFARSVGAKMTWLSHIAHDLDHEETNRSLPRDIQLSYDGQEIEFHVG